MKRIILKIGDEDYKDHREDFETCPCCNYKMDADKWEKIAHILILQPRYSKKGCVTIISKCPKCAYVSWVHEPMDCFQYRDWPENWKKEVKKLEEIVKLNALREWAISLCGQCKKLKNGRIDHGTYRTCDRGSGPAELKCELFEKWK